MMFFILSLHNFPEGLAVSVSTLKSSDLGLNVAFTIALHNIMEGVVIATPIFAATHSKFLAIFASLLSGLSEPCGALVALFFVCCGLYIIINYYSSSIRTFLPTCI